jgi:hypothetical protein
LPHGPVTLGLRGRHPIANAAVAVRLLEAARTASRCRRTRSPGPGQSAVAGQLSFTLDDGARSDRRDAQHRRGATALAGYLRHPAFGGHTLVWA